MATRAEVEQVAAALNRLSLAARADLARVLAGVNRSDPAALREALAPIWADLVGHYGDMSAVLAADVAEAQLAKWGMAGVADPVRGVDASRAIARMRWAIGVADAFGSLNLLTDELVKQPYRSTLANAAYAAGVHWARIPSGKTCAFCLMLASRGAVYRTAHAAGQGNSYHGDCDCVPTMVRDDEDYPEGYDPDALYAAYRQAADDATSHGTKAALAELRKQQGSH